MLILGVKMLVVDRVVVRMRKYLLAFEFEGEEGYVVTDQGRSHLEVHEIELDVVEEEVDLT